MSFPSLLLEYLKNNRRAPLAGFGVFYLKSASAIVETEGNSILPPATEIAFVSGAGDMDSAFTQFLAHAKNISISEAETEIKKQVAFWTSILEKEGRLTVEDLGTFYLNDSIISFTGKRLNHSAPDFYGLDEINLSKINNRRGKIQNLQEPYAVSKSLYWLLPLMLALGALTYFGISQPERIFGKKTFFDKEAQARPVIDLKPVLSPHATITAKNADSANTDSMATSKTEEIGILKKY